MAVNRKRPEEDEAAGAPEWMVTFCDCMTLLLTFFVLLLSFSSFDDAAMTRVQKSIGHGEPASATQRGSISSSLAPKKTIKKVKHVSQGSKTPTTSKESIGSIAKNRRLSEYKRQKVFSIASNKIFVGEAIAINPANKKILVNIVKFLKAMPSRVVICEFDPANPNKSDRKSIQRAWTLLKYFVDSDIKADRFSITGSSMLVRNDDVKDRQIVITLLEEGIYE